MVKEVTPAPRILLVDDDRELRARLTEALARSGYEVSELPDGEAALEAIKRLRPDCVILDILMPRLDGYWVCRALKADPDTAAIPVLLLTALSRKEDLLQGLGAGAEDFIRKPFDLQELLARVEAQLRVKRRHDAVAKERNDLRALLEVSQAVSSTLRSREIFQIIVRETARIIASVRCSLLLIADDPLYAYVLASHDDAAVDRLKIELAKYPELQEAIRTRAPVLIDDVHTHPLLSPVRDGVHGEGLRAGRRTRGGGGVTARDTTTTVARLVAQVCDLDAGEVHPAGKLVAYGIDSVRSLELLLAIEDAFSVEISQQDPDLMGIRTVQDLADLVERRRR
jgi:DNA-binding response OmpR family regulator/acyl carrier protein